MNRKHRQVMVQIGLNILYYRKACGMTQQELAERLHYSKNHVQQVETACAVPSVALLLDVAETLGIPPHKLFEFK